MSFSRKFSRSVETLNEAFPAKECEPTIAEDYAEKWPEIQRKRLINKISHITFWTFLAILLVARIWLGVAVLKQLYLSVWPFGPIVTALIYVLILDFAQNLKCPRCHKRFHGYSRYDFLNDAKARCQYCNLQLGEPFNQESIR